MTTQQPSRAAPPRPHVSYDHWRSGLRGYKDRLMELVDAEQPTTVCDVGGGAQPRLTVDEVTSRGLDYTLLDISAEELGKAPDVYTKVQQDICRPLPADAPRYDFVLSHMLAEHLADPVGFHRNVFALLNPGGVAVHMMPTYYEPAFVANKLLPERLTKALVERAQPGRDFGHLAGKFPAYYRWCRGPSRRHVHRLESLGYEVDHMIGYFGTGYLARVPLLQKVYEKLWTASLLRRPVPLFTSYCWMVLRKPG